MTESPPRRLNDEESTNFWDAISGPPENEHFWWDDRQVKLRIGGRDGTDILFSLLEPYNRAGAIITVDPAGQPPETVTRPPSFIPRELTPLERLGPDKAPYTIDQYRLIN